MGKTKLRIMGTSEEVQELVSLLSAIVDVSSISKEYPNRGSNEVRVYVDCTIDESNPYTKAMKQYAEYKNQIGSIMIVAATPEGEIIETHVATSSKSFLIMYAHFLSDKFTDSLRDHMKEFEHSIQDNSEVQ